MARLFSSGFELNSATSDIEFSTGNGSPSVQGTTVRSGSYALQITSLTSATRKTLGGIFEGVANLNGPLFVRVYLRVATRPSAANRIIYCTNAAGFATTNMRVGIDLTSAGELQLRDEDGTIGSVSGVLALNTWYRVEIEYDSTAAAGSHIVRARLDGLEFAAATNRSISGGWCQVYFGGNLNLEAQTTGDWFFDDYAINDSTGSSQTSYPGEGKIVHLHPDGAGDNAADSGTFADIDEVTPNDATDFINLDTATSIADYTCEASSVPGIGASDTITLVQVGWRIREEVSTTTAFNARIKSASGGTTTSGTTYAAGDTTWRTSNNNLTSFSGELYSYTDPTTAVAWTPTGTNSLDNMQIGIASTNANNIDVSTLWALVEYVPYVAPPAPATGSTMLMMGV